MWYRTYSVLRSFGLLPPQAKLFLMFLLFFIHFLYSKRNNAKNKSNRNNNHWGELWICENFKGKKPSCTVTSAETHVQYKLLYGSAQLGVIMNSPLSVHVVRHTKSYPLLTLYGVKNWRTKRQNKYNIIHEKNHSYF